MLVVNLELPTLEQLPVYELQHQITQETPRNTGKDMRKPKPHKSSKELWNPNCTLNTLQKQETSSPQNKDSRLDSKILKVYFENPAKKLYNIKPKNKEPKTITSTPKNKNKTLQQKQKK